METLLNHNDCHNVTFTNEKLQKPVSKVMEETEEEKCNVKHNAKNVTMDTFCQSPVTTNTQRNNTNVTNERRISSDILENMIKGFEGLTLQSTINDSAYYDSDESESESDPKIDQLVATCTSVRTKRKVTDTDTTNRNSPHLLLINRLIPEIIPVIIPKIDLLIADGVTASKGNLHACQTITPNGDCHIHSEQRRTCFLRSYCGLHDALPILRVCGKGRRHE